MERKSKNKLICCLSGQIRQSNQFYINKRAKAAGVSEELFRSAYATKSALTNLKSRLKSEAWSEVRNTFLLTTQQLVNVLRVNGRGAQLDQFRCTVCAEDYPDDTLPTSENKLVTVWSV
jgi:hypothetical protein